MHYEIGMLDKMQERQKGCVLGQQILKLIAYSNFGKDST